MRLACFFTALYEITLYKEDICKAINDNNYEWLNYIWAFKRNYIGDYPYQNKKPKFVEMEHLFDWIGDKYRVQEEQGVIDHPTAIQKKSDERHICCEWYLDNAHDKTDNIIKALLLHQEDILAIRFMGYYSILLQDTLFLFSLRNNN